MLARIITPPNELRALQVHRPQHIAHSLEDHRLKALALAFAGSILRMDAWLAGIIVMLAALAGFWHRYAMQALLQVGSHRIGAVLPATRLLLAALLLAPLAALTAATTKAESHSPANLLLEAKVSEVAPGVFRIRTGEPERIVPSLVRAPANTDALAAMPKIAAPPLPVSAIKIWRLAHGWNSIDMPMRNQ